MNRFSLFLLSFVFLAIFSCKKDDDIDVKEATTKDLNVKFVCNFDDNPLVMGEEVVYDSKTKVKLRTVDFFVSDLTLLGATKDTVIQEIGYVDFTTSNLSVTGAAAGLTNIFKNIPVGNYRGIKLGMGVKADLNAKDPSEFSKSNPLSNAALYWAGWKSFIFSRFEGKYDVDNAGKFTDGFTYHSGRDKYYIEVEINEPFTVSASSDNNEVVIQFDVKNLFLDDNSNYLDIAKFFEVHGSDENGVLEMFKNNFKYALSIR